MINSQANDRIRNMNIEIEGICIAMENAMSRPEWDRLNGILQEKRRILREWEKEDARD